MDLGTTTYQSNGMAAVPSTVRDEFDLEPGDELEWQYDMGRIVVVPAGEDEERELDLDAAEGRA